MGEIRAARVLVAATLLVGSAGLVLAAPANAGCETHPTKTEQMKQYCDLPLRPDGTWDRCRILLGYGIRGINGHKNTEMRCYPIDPTKSWPVGEPQHRIEP